MNLKPISSLIAFILFFISTSYSKDTNNIYISHESGYYDDNFNLRLSSQIPDATILFTLDGSNPQTSKTVIKKEASALVTINPNSSKRRSPTPAVILRASIKIGNTISSPTSRTFIFMNKVMTQKRPDRSWPASSNLHQMMDYDMNTQVTNSTQYKDYINETLINLPTLSLITADANLFNSNTGIYVNDINQGKEWERECAIELLDYKGTKGFNSNAGLSIRRDNKHKTKLAKHSFHVFFREEYGKKSLKHPLFGADLTSSFVKLDLDAIKNDTSITGNGDYSSLSRDKFARESQGDMGQAHMNSCYYHLYLNGMYWGIYQIQEKVDGQYGAHYWGGDNNDYDIIKNTGRCEGEKHLEAIYGTMDKWEEVYNWCLNGLASNEAYFFLEGKDKNGIPINGAEVFIDIDNLIDYMITRIYMGNYKGMSLQREYDLENRLAITNHNDKSQGFRFIIQENDYALLADTLAYEKSNCITGETSGEREINVDIMTFSIECLHHQLSANKEYRLQFSDKAYQALTGNGTFTPHRSRARFKQIEKDIEAITLVESARWKDNNSEDNKAQTKKKPWLTSIKNINGDYFLFRTNTVIKQLSKHHLYPLIKAPQVNDTNNKPLTGTINLNGATHISFVTPHKEDNIYYTTDGTDPRQIGGDLSPSAIKINNGSQLTIKQSTVIQARILHDDVWGAINKITFLTKQTDYSNLKVTELNYHPMGELIDADTLGAKKYEFIEFRNVSSTAPINLTGLSIDSGINYTFPENHLLAPESYFVVAAEPRYFYERYGIPPSGKFSKHLSNSSERIVINNDEGEAIIDFIYNAENKKLANADGKGATLSSESAIPNKDPNALNYWRLSNAVHGTPFTNDSPTSFSAKPPEIEMIKAYPNPTTNVVNIKIPEYNGSFSQAILYDINGTIIYQTKFMSRTSILFNSLHVKPGVYILKVKCGEWNETKRIIYTRR